MHCSKLPPRPRIYILFGCLEWSLIDRYGLYRLVIDPFMAELL